MTPPPPLKDTNLFKPIKVGSVTLQNRLVFAPTTRFRNTEDFVATNLMKKHYEDRAENNGGLLIGEATYINLGGGLYPHGPVIESKRQVEAWKQIVDAVHAKGSAIALQIYHLGRTADAALLKTYGEPFLAPSAEYFDEGHKEVTLSADCFDENHEQVAIKAGNELRAFTLEEVKQMIEDFKTAAIHAIKVAGFDFVELHAAHMYTMAQFLEVVSNHRTDEWFRC
ncbi:unnamed protein product [Ambrosiozyma monospora]|uniref:Unnamed protein product n=1 Tax=Ambrosiozyma monospora TaxID=43982 RepID=A0ACB5TBD6_AMBMO|nr:unnamed protein product [Ambrosiozyma monospora]